MAMSVFESRHEQSKEKKLSVPISLELNDLISSIEEDLKTKAPDKRFNTTSICVDALKKAARKAKRELAQMK